MGSKVVQSSLIRQVKSLGASITNPSLQNEVIKWIQDCSSSSSKTLEDLNVVLFDSHDDTMARKLINLKAKSVLLLEGSQMNADKQKENTDILEEEFPDRNITALHASMTNILSPSKSMKISLPFWKRLTESMNPPQVQYRNYPSPKPSESKVVMCGLLPFPNQQRALLTSLMEQILIYYDSKSREIKQEPFKKWTSKESEAPRTYFSFTPFSLITFLHPSHLTRLISSIEPELSFYTKSHRHFSYLFNSFFSVDILDSNGYDLSSFHPEIPLSPITSYKKNIEKAGYIESKFYPVKIQSRNELIIPENHVIPFKKEKKGEAIEADNKNLVMDYAFWLLHTARSPKQKKITWDKFGLGNSSSPITAKDYALIFPQVHPHLHQHYINEINAFRTALLKDKTDEGDIVD